MLDADLERIAKLNAVSWDKGYSIVRQGHVVLFANMAEHITLLFLTIYFALSETNCAADYLFRKRKNYSTQNTKNRSSQLSS